MSRKKIFFIILIFIILTISMESLAGGPGFVLVYVIQEGDTLYDIARDYQISLKEILEKNNLDENGPFLRPGDEILLYTTGEEEQKAQDSPRQLNFSLDLGREENSRQNFRLDMDIQHAIRINKGQVLPEVDIPQSQLLKYHVKSGDTLYDLARAFNTTTGIIMVLNEMQNNIIRPGQELVLPVNNLSSREVVALTISEEERVLLAHIIHAEARGEPLIGQIAVGAVVINRLLSPLFPDSIREVIYQERQFSAVADGQMYLTPNRISYVAVAEVLKGVDPTNGALYYYNPETANYLYWFESALEKVVTIGAHVFAK